MSVRNLQFCNGVLSYRGYTLEEDRGIGDEYVGYIYLTTLTIESKISY